MKSAAAILFLAFAIHFANGAAALKTEKLWLFGKEYYRLDQWARASGFQLKWLGRKEVQVGNSSVRMQFTGDSRRSSINGVLVVLSHEVVVKNGLAYITPLDVNTTLAPLLWPPREGRQRTVRHICLDPGHGGKDIGEHSGREHEKRYTLLLAQELAEELRKAGYTVSLTRTTDVALDLPSRAEIARRRGADLFISLHFNSDGNAGGQVRGAETYCLTPARANSTNDQGKRGNTSAVNANRHDVKNVLLAYHIHKAILRDAGAEDRGVKRARFEVLRLAEMPAVLIESAFMSNAAEAKKIATSAWRRRVAQGIVNGISSYRSAVER